jgi:hypothetical protein
MKKYFDLRRIEEIERHQTVSEKQQTELILKKQLEFEKVKQQELKNLQLPAHANWAKTQSNSFTSSGQLPLKSIVEQQAIESMEKQRQLMEQQKQQQQAELAASQTNSWSALFRNANKQSASITALNDIQSEELKQQELIRIQQEQQAQMIKLQQQKEAQAKSIIKQSSTSWAAWSQAQQQQAQQANNNPNFPPPQVTTATPTNTSTNNSSTGFWNETQQQQQQETKKSNEKTTKNNSNKSTNNNQKSSKPAHAVEPPQNMFKNPTEEFMKWCGEQLKDFNADRKT